ncbi:molybdopterin molybdotransferase MoeA [Sulfurovum sp.]|jgi:molybdopterin molybdotransferase|uniref:molybdopterin molybdotransferase MoeA n=1 Tax=Sulfurovum sp. TaxID=1969726 RepID=UPI002A3617C1|nr:molybdopterin molybdotransferase MoeA [Sulfurovum sp.]MDD3498923.1 molybdopterin molybdotransferase MoeA [Sulfurovum sp.]MDY0402693.1 molybdopterin molybdotransferase MoeA [Sulfurovum sp.]
MFMHFDESMQIIEDQKITHYKTKKLYLMESLGYVLAENIIADHNSPALPTSAMDGYAFRHEDITLGRLKIASINPAGSALKEKVLGGTCIKTFTGSLMPEGADTLIPIENVEVEGDEIVIKEEVPFGFSVREVGENYAKGQKLIAKGTMIDFPQIGVMASLNVISPLVYEKPVVSILSTGSELLELGQTQTNDAQIRSSNNYILEAIAVKYGGRALQMGCIRDDKQSIQDAVAAALEKSDIVVTTGGVSVGDFDFVKDVIAELGAEVLFKGVRIKPGQHIMVARKGDKFIVGLPGFAYSSTVTALLYVLPLIAKLQQGKCALRKVKAVLDEPFKKRAKKAEFTACNLRLIDGRYHIDFKEKKVGTSAILTNMLGEVALLFTGEEEGSKEKGDEVTVLLLG